MSLRKPISAKTRADIATVMTVRRNRRAWIAGFDGRYTIVRDSKGGVVNLSYVRSTPARAWANAASRVRRGLKEVALYCLMDKTTDKPILENGKPTMWHAEPDNPNIRR